MGDEGKRRQGGMYDKIFRENMEVILPSIVRNLLGLRMANHELLPDTIQHTKERKPDLLRKITDPNGKKFVLHIEYQVKNENDMAIRMAEYYIMLLRRYRLPVKQYVLYLGRGKGDMPVEIKEEDFLFRYNLLKVKEIDYRVFLKFPYPEAQIMAILGNFGEQDKEHALRLIIQAIHQNTSDGLVKGRLFRQLRVLAQLRNFNDLKISEIMGDLSSYFSHDKDIVYLLGKEKGIEKGIEKGQESEKRFFVRNLLLYTDFSDERIASLAGVSAAFVSEQRSIPDSL